MNILVFNPGSAADSMEGLMMGTRSGDVDPGLLLYLIRSAGMTAANVNELLNRQCGLLGVSELSADVRDIEAASRTGNAKAELALELFAYRACKYVGALAVVLEGPDAIVFTGGIGEHSSSMRARICRRLEFLGVKLRERSNVAATGSAAARISAKRSAVAVWVIPTDEEGEIVALCTPALYTG